jgi:AraC-like DNA-binding protein
MPLLNEGQALIMASKDAATEGRLAVRTVPAVGPDRGDAKDGTRVSETTRRRLAAARDLIERDFRRRRLSLSDVAEAAHLSIYHFHRLFRRHYGMTPKQAINALRVAEVQRLMLSGASLIEASAAVGFSHQSHMTCRFKQFVGMTPRQWLVKVRRGDAPSSSYAAAQC